MYTYNNLGSPTGQYIQQQEHIVGGAEVYADIVSQSYFDGLGRTYKTQAPGENNKTIVTETRFDNLGRVSEKSHPYFAGETAYHTILIYDGLSRLRMTIAPDDSVVRTFYRGLTKVVADQNDHSTTYTYDIYKRLRRVQDAKGTVTEYDYDILGNLTRVTAAKGLAEQNVTVITYDSLSKKRSMTDPNMGYWNYEYDKLGNLMSQIDAKGKELTFTYDGLGRLTRKHYPNPPHDATYTYDDASIPYSMGKLTSVTDSLLGETHSDVILEFDVLQRVTKSKKSIGRSEDLTMARTYDSAGRPSALTYFPGTVSEKKYIYAYDQAGNLLSVYDNSGRYIVQYSDFTALGQHKRATFPKDPIADYYKHKYYLPAIQSTYTYDPTTSRIRTMVTQKLVNGAVAATYQNLDYTRFDSKGNLITLTDVQNKITHTYQYDSLDRLLSANGTGDKPYTQTYTYDSIGNIISKQ